MCNIHKQQVTTDLCPDHVKTQVIYGVASKIVIIKHHSLNRFKISSLLKTVCINMDSL